MPDLFFYRDPEEVEREEAAKEAEVVAVMYIECGPASHVHCLDCRKQAARFRRAAVQGRVGRRPTGRLCLVIIVVGPESDHCLLLSLTD